MRGALAAFCLVAAPAAAQECATVEDLAAGIVFEYASGGQERLVAVDDVTVHSFWTEDGDESEALLARGLYFVVDLTDGREELFRPVGGYAALPVPEPGLTAEVALLEVQAGGIGDFVTWTITVAPPQEFTAGPCTYQMLAVTLTQPDVGSVETIHYFPQLGVGAFVGYDDGQSEPYDNSLVGLRPSE